MNKSSGMFPGTWRRSALALCLLAGTCFFSACSLMPKEEEVQTAPLLTEAKTEDYVLSQVMRGDVEAGLSVRCTYIPSAEEKLSFSVGGEPIGNVYVSLGDTVEAGDLLMELNVSAYDREIESQQNELDNLELSLSQLYASWQLDLEEAELIDAHNEEVGIETSVKRKDSVNSGYATRRNLLAGQIEVGKLRLSELMEQKKSRQIYASITGTVTQLVHFDPGETAVKGNLVIQIANMDEALFEAYSGNTESVKSGEKYELVCGGNTYSVTARMGSELSAQSAKEDKMYFVLDVPDPSLSRGDSGSVRVTLESRKNTLYVPSEAVHNLAGETVVYRVGEDGFRVVQPVEIGLVSDKVTEILSGLEEGWDIILR